MSLQISTIFNQYSIQHYESLHEKLNRSNLLAGEQLATLLFVIMYEIGYLFGSDLRWEETGDDVNANAESADAEPLPPDADLGRRGQALRRRECPGLVHCSFNSN